MSDEAQELRRVRDKLSALGGAQWFLAADGHSSFVEAKSANGDVAVVARFDQGATPEEMDFFSNAPYMAAFLLELVDRAIASMRRNQPRQAQQHGQNQGQGQERQKDFATEAAMKCAEPAFKQYLHEKHGLEKPLTDERVSGKLRSVLGITSRKVLNDDAQAAERWRSLRADYTAWRRASR